MAAIGRDPEPKTPEEAQAREERVAKLHQQCDADYRTGFGKPQSGKTLAD